MLQVHSKVSVSVTDFPIFRKMDFIFHGLKAAGADGVEITPGIKTRWSFNKLKELSGKYNLPITSIHQPLWSVAGFFFDEGFLTEAKDMRINIFVFHPLSRYSFDDDRMKQFLQRLADLQQKHGVSILVENTFLITRMLLILNH